MPGPRAGFSGIIVRMRDEYSGAEIERMGFDVASPMVHRSCQQGSDCKGSGCRIRTGKTSGNLAEVRKMRERMNAATARREAMRQDNAEALRFVAESPRLRHAA